MGNKENVLYVICETQEAAERYQELATKMLTDTAFLEKCKTCKTSEELYQTYKDFGYTDMEFEDFEKAAGDTFQFFVDGNNDSRELSSEELEAVVGGIRLVELAASVISYIPVAGPFMASAVKCYDGAENRTMRKQEAYLELTKGVAGSIVDLGAGVFSGGTSWAVRLAVGAGSSLIKYGINSVNFS